MKKELWEAFISICILIEIVFLRQRSPIAKRKKICYFLLIGIHNIICELISPDKKKVINKPVFDQASRSVSL